MTKPKSSASTNLIRFPKIHSGSITFCLEGVVFQFFLIVLRNDHEELFTEILQENFKMKYCTETLILENEMSYAATMVSFCDIPLSQIKDPIGKYGAYGIGLTKEWTQRQKLNPVIYIQSGSFLASSIHESYRSRKANDQNYYFRTD